jgi:hypothetical protein
MIGKSGGVHTTGNIDRVTPDVVLRFASSDDSGNDRTDVDSDPDHEVVVRVVVDVLELLAHAKYVLDELEYGLNFASAIIFL